MSVITESYDADHVILTVASLLNVQGQDALRLLFSRHSHHQFSYSALLTVLALYFFMTCWASTSAVACGTVVPMLWVLAHNTIQLTCMSVVPSKDAQTIFYVKVMAFFRNFPSFLSLCPQAQNLVHCKFGILKPEKIRFVNSYSILLHLFYTVIQFC